jgi:hypothetical protein
MPLDVDALADAVATAMEARLAPVLARLAVLEQRALTPGPPGRDGQDGLPGKDGADGLPGKDGRDGAAGKDGLPGRDGKDGINGRDGKDGLNGRDGADGLHGKDGAPGKDGADGRDGEPGLNGKDGRDAVMENIQIVQSKDLRTATFCWKDGTPISGGTLRFDVPIYRGVWLAGQTYQRGDTVHKDKSLFIADCETSEKPGDGSKSWRLAAARGGVGPSGPEGPRGKDLTQMGTQGEKWR